MKKGNYKSEAVVLFTMTYGESDSILTLFTSDYGKIKGIAKGARRSRKRFVGLLDPPSHIALDFHHSGKSDLVRVEAAREVDGFAAIKSDIDKLSYGSYFLELVNEMTGEGEECAELFSLLTGFLRMLSDTDNPEFLARSFEMRLLISQGYMPHLSGCVVCAGGLAKSGNFFSSVKGGMVCAVCAPKSKGSGLIPTSTGTASFLKAAARFETSKLARLVPNRINLEESDRLLSDFIRFQTGRELKTRKFMESLRAAAL